MKKKYVLSVGLAVATLAASASVASAHGWGLGMAKKATPEEIVQHQTDMFQRHADILGISVAEIKDAWAKGQTVQEIAKAKGLSETQLKEKVHAARKADLTAQLKVLVEKGVITQTQADQRLKTIEARMGEKAKQGKGGFRGSRHMRMAI